MADDSVMKTRAMKFLSCEDGEIRHSPERNLISAVVERAILDSGSKEVRISAEARIWLFESRQIHAFSFRWCCTEMGWDFREIRRGIRNLGFPVGIDELYCKDRYKKIRKLHG
jgi:hypothetical protein